MLTAVKMESAPRLNGRDDNDRSDNFWNDLDVFAASPVDAFRMRVCVCNCCRKEELVLTLRRFGLSCELIVSNSGKN